MSKGNLESRGRGQNPLHRPHLLCPQCHEGNPQCRTALQVYQPKCFRALKLDGSDTFATCRKPDWSLPCNYDHNHQGPDQFFVLPILFPVRKSKGVPLTGMNSPVVIEVWSTGVIWEPYIWIECESTPSWVMACQVSNRCAVLNW